MAAGLAIDGAGVHACRAADALERLPFLGFGEDAGASVVEQDDMKFLRAIAGRDTGPERCVRVHALAGGGASQKLEHDFKILEAGQHLLYTHQADQSARQCEAHAAVALGLDY